jgi:RNA polymerase sigma-70 factor (family 1)
MTAILQNDTFENFQKGDEIAFRKIYNHFYPALFHFAKKLTGSREEAEDIALNTFQKLYNLRDKFNTEDNVKAFLYISVRNKGLNYLRSTKHSQEKVKRFAERMADDTLLSYEYEGKEELLQTIRDAVERLPEERRKIFKMLYYEELKPAEIAEILRISVFTVYTQKSKAIETLRLMLGDNSPAIAWLLYTLICLENGVIHPAQLLRC